MDTTAVSTKMAHGVRDGAFARDRAVQGLLEASTGGGHHHEARVHS